MSETAEVTPAFHELLLAAVNDGIAEGLALAEMEGHAVAQGAAPNQFTLVYAFGADTDPRTLAVLKQIAVTGFPRPAPAASNENAALGLVPDRAMLDEFRNRMFRHADPNTFISLRAFHDHRDGERPLFIEGVPIGAPDISDRVFTRAAEAAGAPEPHVFCPPVATFRGPRGATEGDLADGVGLSVECDENAAEALTVLRDPLGEPTAFVQSGGEWVNPDTGEIEPKLHLHWRLKQPARTPEEHSKLKLARALATRLVRGDPSNAPAAHPIRWPGSWHRKGEPRLAMLAGGDPESEVDLEEALGALMEAAGSDEAATSDPVSRISNGDLAGKIDDVAAALAVIPNPDLVWDDWNRIGMAIYAATDGHGFEAFDAWCRKSGKYNSKKTLARWDHYSKHPPTRIGMGALVFMAREAVPGWRKPSSGKAFSETVFGQAGQAVANRMPQAQFDDAEQHPLFDPWRPCIVPDFPLEVLPAGARAFVTAQAKVIGADVNGIAMAALAAMSGAIDHRFTLRMLRNGDWLMAPRMWVLLVGNPSTKKTPVMSAVTKALNAHQNRVRDEYDRQATEWEAAVKAGDKDAPEPAKPPRFVVHDVTPEKLGEILARSDRGTLVFRDELGAWLGEMEKYGGGRGAGANRGFWLGTYNGGTHLVDRMHRGELRVRNLSVSFLGGVQPQRLAEIGRLATDGLLQRFLPVMLGPTTFFEDVETGLASRSWETLVQALLQAQPADLIMTPGAYEAAREFQRYLHDFEAVAGGLADGFEGFIGKLPGVLGSLAVILHLAHSPHHGGARPVERGTIEAAAAVLRDFVIPHAVEFYRTSETTTGGDRLQRVCSYILTSGKNRLVSSDLTSNVAHLKGLTLAQLHEQLSPLVAGNWLFPEEAAPLNRAWLVNPVVHERMRERAALEETRKRLLAEKMGSSRRART